MTAQTDDAIREALRPAREATFTSADAARAITAAQRPARQKRSRSRSRTLGLALGFAALLTTTAVAVPTSMFGWLDDGTPPGRELRPDDDAPAWVRAAKAQTLVAENGGLALYAVREADGQIGFALDGSVGISDNPDGWRDQFDDHAVVMLGPGGVDGKPFDAQGRRPLYGLTADSVARVELRYDSGPPQVARGLDGGFVLLADARRPLSEIVAYDAQGRVLESRNLDLDLRVCMDERGCPPGKLQP